MRAATSWSDWKWNYWLSGAWQRGRRWAGAMFAWEAASGQPRIEIDGIGPEIDKGCKWAGRLANARLFVFLCGREDGGPRVVMVIDGSNGGSGSGTSSARSVGGDSDGAVPTVAVGEGEGEGEGEGKGEQRASEGGEKKKDSKVAGAAASA